MSEQSIVRRRGPASWHGALAVPLATLVVDCGSPPQRLRDEDTYLRWIAYEVPGNESVLLRWSKRQMPLRVYLPRPPEGLFSDPVAIHDSVRDGVLDWADIVEPGLPSFVFVGDPGDADIPIVWAAEPDGDWYIAHCAYRIQPFARRFGVERILVTGRWRGNEEADLHDIYSTLLHEMGHALGIMGHSPNPEDIMYRAVVEKRNAGLSDRDRKTLAELYRRPIGKRIIGARSGRHH